MVNKIKNEIEINKLLDKSFHYKKNIIKTNRHNTKIHELAKCLVCLELNEEQADYYTEAIFKNGQRADIINISGKYAIEIMHTETPEKLLKTKEYPIPIIKIDAISLIKKTIKKYE